MRKDAHRRASCRRERENDQSLIVKCNLCAPAAFPSAPEGFQTMVSRSDTDRPFQSFQRSGAVFSPGAVPADYLSRPTGSCGRRQWQGGHYSLTGVRTPENTDAGMPSFIERIGCVRSCVDVTAGSRVKILSFVFEELNGWIKQPFCTRAAGHVSRGRKIHQIFSVYYKNKCYDSDAVVWFMCECFSHFA